MLSTMSKAVYNLPVLHMRISWPRGLRLSGLSFLFCIFLGISAVRASDWTAPEEQLARKIVAVTGPGAVALDVANRSSLTKAEVDEIRRGLTTQLAAVGLRFVQPEQSAATVNITLSENLLRYVWVAEIQQGTNAPAVEMVSLPRPAAPIAARDPSTMFLHKIPLWSQDDPILDVAVLEGSPAHMVVLDPSHVAIYRLQDNRWQMEQSLPITHSRPWPRDLRGRLRLRSDHLFDAYLPGILCRSTAAGKLSMTCHESDDPWPLGTDTFPLGAFFAPSRNFFTGALTPGVGKQKTAPAFYSAAMLPRDKYTLVMLATVDGEVHLLDGITDRSAGKMGWGSDIASIKTSCSSGTQVLATRAGDGPGDAVRAFEVADREPLAVSPEVDFSGSITALWTESSGNSAIAVSRNPEMGKYEANRLTLTCGQ